MRFVSAASQNEPTAAAVEEVIRFVQTEKLKPDIIFAFFTGEHRDEADAIAEKLWLELDPQVAIGASAEGVIGGDREIERSPAIAILVGELPGVRLHPFHIGADDWRAMLAEPDRVLEAVAYGAETRGLIGFGDPFTTPLNQMLPLIDTSMPGVPLIGGMASSARQPGENALIRNDQVFTDGFVGVSLSGPIEIDTVVSQGARPIGMPMVITKGQKNVIEQLGGKAPLAALQEIVNELSDADKSLLSRGLLIGRAMSEYKDSFGRGDFVIRNVMGVDQNSGAIAVTDLVKVGQTVQFHVRDGASASEDLAQLLSAQQSKAQAAGALLFSCNGRGSRMFDTPNHDLAAAHQAIPQLPVAGFFAAGEIGPVGGKNFIHGHTASFALFRAG